jgi:opacity protein-like surface antigen
MGIPDVRVRWGILLTVLLIGWTVAPAQAQWMATPYLGVNFAGDVEKRKGGPGGSIGYFADLLGFEFDFQLFKHFFKDADVADLVPNGVDLDTDATSFMGNVVTPIRIPGATNVRPYGTAGIGVIRAVFDTSYDLADTDQNDLGFNVGGGSLFSLNERVGLRGEVRYMRRWSTKTSTKAVSSGTTASGERQSVSRSHSVISEWAATDIPVNNAHAGVFHQLEHVICDRARPGDPSAPPVGTSR